MKAVLISIRPQWCELIANGRKTVEVRKTKPNLAPPFKVYIYCTQGKSKGDFITKSEKFGYIKGHEGSFYNRAKEYDANGKVIGEFVCNNISYIEAGYDTNGDKHLYNTAFIERRMCIPDNELHEYLYKNRENCGGWAWHISNLVIYDKPRALCKFSKYGFDRFVPLKRPPQSWCYIDERTAGK